jgi:hypothetical protein
MSTGTEDEKRRTQAAQLDSKVEKQVHQLAESFHVDLDSLEGVQHVYMRAWSCRHAACLAYHLTSAGTAGPHVRCSAF